MVSAMVRCNRNHALLFEKITGRIKERYDLKYRSTSAEEGGN